MKQFFPKSLFWLFVILFLFIIAFFVLVTKVDYDSDIPVEKEVPGVVAFDLLPHLQHIDLTNLKENFPYSTYLDSANLRNINSILKDLAAMDSVNPGNEMMNQEILSIAFTQKLEERIKSRFAVYNPDSLIRIIQWAEKFNTYAEMDKDHAILFQVIYSHWFNFVSNTLQEYYEKEYAVKYNYKFRYINDRLKEKQFFTPIKGTYLEKIIRHLIEKNWSYLFNKFWHATTWVYKCVVMLLVLIIIFPYFYIFKRYITRKQS